MKVSCESVVQLVQLNMATEAGSYHPALTEKVKAQFA